jgi:PKD repeat protein
MQPRFYFAAAIVAAAFAGSAQQTKLSDHDVAIHFGITVQQLHGVEGQYGLSNDQLLNLPWGQVQTMASDLDAPGHNKHAEEQYYRALRMMDEHGKIPPDGLMRALEHRHHIKSTDDGDLEPGQPDPSTNEPSFGTPGPLVAGILTNGWTWLGPGNIGGRVRAIVPHPTDPNTLWAGGVDGGIWKTTNGATSWFPLDDFMANLAVACVVMDPADTNVLYAGTGEGTYNVDAIRGAGIFKTIDGGANWVQLSATANANFQYVSRLSIDPTNSQTILAATRSGIWRSTNGGTNWSQRLSTEMLCIAYHPTDSTKAIASGYNSRVYYSTDGGLSWPSASGLPVLSAFVAGRVELAYSRSSPDLVFATLDNLGGQAYRSQDGGHSYVLCSATTNLFGTTGSLGAQGWYDNAIWADPFNTNVVIVAGTDVKRSSNGGTNFTAIGGYSGSIHPDQHVIVAGALYDGNTVRTVFVGNDGGIFKATDIYSVSSSKGWQNLNHNLGITQFYGAAGNAGSGVIVGGTQDNGTLRYSTAGGQQGWTSMFGGDGGMSASDPGNANYFYGEYVNLRIHRSTDGGLTSSYIYTGISDAGTSAANFIAPFILDPNNANTMLAGGSSLWRSTNVKNTTPTWTAIKASTNSPISAIAVAPGNSSVIFVGHNSGAIYVTTNGTDPSPTWVQRNSGLPGRTCTSIAISPNPGAAYATFGGYNPGNVWKTINYGASWINISGNLPSAPMNWITIAPPDANTLYVGSDVGVYGTANNGGLWSTGNDGPANVAVDQLFWLGNKLIAVTHGRGLFSTTPAVGPPGLTPNGFTLVDPNSNGSVDPNECSQLYLSVLSTNGSTAMNVTAVLSSSTPGVTVMQNFSSYPDIARSNSAANITPFTINSSPSLPCGTPVILNLAVGANGATNNLAFTLPSVGSYNLTQSTGASIVPGTSDIGNHGDNVLTGISLPFNFTFYNQAYNYANVSANGNLQFVSANSAWVNTCLPSSGFNYAIYPFWTDLRTDLTNQGVFVATNGTAPTRTFDIEWRASLVSSGASVNFEVVLYEAQSRYDLIYGTMNDAGSTATIGAQSDTGSAFTSYGCNAGNITSGLQLSYLWQCADGGGQCAPVANFAGSPISGPVPLTVAFSNLSLVATNYSWDFGDGNTSTLTNPTNTYALAGSYTVALSVNGPGGSNYLNRPAYILVTNVPPSISPQPVGATVAQGTPVTFTTGATGTVPLSFQWRFGGSNISGATLTSLSIPSPQCGDAGNYDVVVTNVGGSITSSVAVLSVETMPGIATQPTNLTILVGQTASFSVVASNSCGGGFIYQWTEQGTNIPGATASVFNRPNAQVPDAAGYAVVVGNLSGSVTSQVATLTVLVPPSGVISPPGVVAAVGSNVSFTVSAAGTTPLSLQWRFAGTNISGATDTTYTRTNAQCADNGGFDVVVTNIAGSSTSAVVHLTVVSPPIIGASPTNLIVLIGQTATFQVSASNNCGGIAYQWLRWSSNVISGVTNSSLVISNAQLSDAANYSTIVSNFSGSATSSIASLTVWQLPGVATNPASRIVATGSNVTFTVAATGTAPLSLQWRFAGTNISGATDTTYTRANVQCADNGGIDVVVTNVAGSTTSSVAALTVVSPPVIGAPPTNLTVQLGQTATFQVSATNDCGGLAYQWLRWGTNIISGATNSSLVISNAQFSDAANYSVIVSNFANSGTSAVATLTVFLPAQLVVNPPGLNFGTLVTGATANASFVISNSGSLQLTGAASISGGPFSFGGGGSGALLVSGFSSTNVPVQFTPLAQGSFSNVITFVSNGGNSTNPLLGVAVLTLSPTILSPVLSGTNFVFSFQTISGKTYLVEYMNTLGGTNWLILQTNIGDGNIQSVVTPATAPPQRFYRLSVQ